MTGTINPQPCPAGSYGNQTKVSVSTDCQPCPGGQYCAGLGLTEPTGVFNMYIFTSPCIQHFCEQLPQVEFVLSL